MFFCLTFSENGSEYSKPRNLPALILNLTRKNTNDEFPIILKGRDYKFKSLKDQLIKNINEALDQNIFLFFTTFYSAFHGKDHGDYGNVVSDSLNMAFRD